MIIIINSLVLLVSTTVLLYVISARFKSLYLSFNIRMVTFILLGFISCKQDKTKPIILYQIEGENSLGKIIRLNSRTTREEIINVIAEIRDQYPIDKQQSFHFYLPGMLPGKSFSYASVFYPTDEDVKRLCKDEDSEGRAIDVGFRGLTPNQADTLLSIQLMNPQYKTIIGKFIIDYPDKSIEIIYTDSREKADKLFIAKYYQDDKKHIPQILSPLIINQDGLLKMIVDEEGDYYVLQDNILCKYAIDEGPDAFSCLENELVHKAQVQRIGSLETE